VEKPPAAFACYGTLTGGMGPVGSNAKWWDDLFARTTADAEVTAAIAIIATTITRIRRSCPRHQRPGGHAQGGEQANPAKKRYDVEWTNIPL
jgi:hypothetical protein